MGRERRKTPTGQDPEDREDDKEVDPIEESIEETFPASDPPSWSTPAPPENRPKRPDTKE